MARRWVAVPALALLPAPVSAWLSELLGGFCSVAGGVLGVAAVDELLVWFCSLAGGVLEAIADGLLASAVAVVVVLGAEVASVAVEPLLVGAGTALAVSLELVADSGALFAVLFSPPLGEVETGAVADSFGFTAALPEG